MFRRLLTAIFGVLVIAASVPARALSSSPDSLQRLFYSYGDTGAGWTGADGTYSVPLPDGRTVWLFSDTFLGPVNADHSRPQSAPFIHNSAIVQDGDSLTTLHGGTDAAPSAWITPADGVSFYWMGDGIVEGDSLRVFVDRFVAAPVPYGFQQVGVDVATFSLPDLTLRGITSEPLAFAPGHDGVPVSYGMAMVRAGGYTYVYGVGDLHLDKYLYVARSRDGVLGTYEYWSGTGWSSNPVDAAHVMTSVGNELSVQATADGFALVTENLGVGKDIDLARAPAPEGPWGARTTIFTTAEDPSLSTYNAKAHPELGDDSHLVVTYNVNSTLSNGDYANVDNYRPRWVDVTL